jgi:hypothetical protein
MLKNQFLYKAEKYSCGCNVFPKLAVAASSPQQSLTTPTLRYSEFLFLSLLFYLALHRFQQENSRGPATATAPPPPPAPAARTFRRPRALDPHRSFVALFQGLCSTGSSPTRPLVSAPRPLLEPLDFSASIHRPRSSVRRAQHCFGGRSARPDGGFPAGFETAD